MKKQHKRVMSCQNQIVQAYTKTSPNKDNLLDTKFILNTKTIINKKKIGFETLYQQQQRYVRSDDNNIEDIKGDFIQVCEREKIKSFYSDYFLRYSQCLLIQQQKIHIIQQISEIESGLSFYQVIMKLVKARSNCIKKLKILLTSQGSNITLINKQSELQKYCCVLSHLRLLTVMITQKIQSWRRSLIELEIRGKKNQYKTDQSLVFLYENKNILHTIYRDCFFLNMTILRKFIHFSKAFDPLMLFPLKKIQNNSETRMSNYDSVIRLFQLGTQMINRLQISHIVLTQQQMMTQQENQKQLEYQQSKKSMSKLRISMMNPEQNNQTITSHMKKSMIQRLSNRILRQSKQKLKQQFLPAGQKSKYQRNTYLPKVEEIQNRSFDKNKSIYKIKKQRIVGQILSSSKFPSIRVQSMPPQDVDKSIQRKTFFKINTFSSSGDSDSKQMILQPSSKSPDRKVGMIKRTTSPPKKHVDNQYNIRSKQLDNTYGINKRNYKLSNRITQSELTNTKLQRRQKYLLNTSLNLIEQHSRKQLFTSKQFQKNHHQNLSMSINYQQNQQQQQQILKNRKPLLVKQQIRQIIQNNKINKEEDKMKQKEKQAITKNNTQLQKQQMQKNMRQVKRRIEKVQQKLDSITVQPKITLQKITTPNQHINTQPLINSHQFKSNIKQSQINGTNNRIENNSLLNVNNNNGSVNVNNNNNAIQISPPNSQPNTKPLIQQIKIQQNSTPLVEQKHIKQQSNKQQNHQQNKNNNSQYKQQKQILQNQPTKQQATQSKQQNLKQQTKSKQILNKIVVSSKNLTPNQLFEYTKSVSHLFDKQQFIYMNQLINGNNKQCLHCHIFEVKVNGNIIGLFILSPKVFQKRIMQMYVCKLYLKEIEKAKCLKLLDNFLDHVWTQDPCQEIHFLQLKDFSDQRMIQLYKQRSFETKTIVPPFPQISSQCYVSKRKKKCKNQDTQQFLFVFQIANISTNYEQSPLFTSTQISQFSLSNYYFPQSTYQLLKYHFQTTGQQNNLSKLQHPQTGNLKFNCQKFQSLSKLNQYLYEQTNLNDYQTNVSLKNICLFKTFIYESFNFHFLVDKKSMVFPLNEKYSTFYQGKQSLILIIKIRRKSGDIFLSFIKSKNSPKSTIEQTIKHIISQTIKDDNKIVEDQLVKIHFFKKKLYGRIMNYQNKLSMFGNFEISMNWIDYLKGTKVIENQEIFMTFEKNFYVALLDQSHNLLFTTYIGAQNML